MKLLVLDAALARCSAAVVVEGAVRAQRMAEETRGFAALLPRMAQAVLTEAGLRVDDLHAVAVTVGPGGFTGIRTALALAHGIGLAAGIEVIGVSVGEAIAALLPQDWPVWCALDSKRGRVFLERDGVVRSLDPADLPVPAAPVLIAGNAAGLVVEHLRAQGAPVQQAAGADAVEPLGLALAAAARHAGRLAPRAAQPLYVDPPEARLPRHVRPAPG